MKRVLDCSQQTPRQERVWSARPLHLVMLMFVLVITACAPQSTLPTQAALPTSAPQTTDVPPVSSETPAVAVVAQAESATATTVPASPTAALEASADTSSVSVPAPSVEGMPTVRVLGVPHIVLEEPSVPDVLVIQVSADARAALDAQVKALGGTVSADESLSALGAVVVTLPNTISEADAAALQTATKAEPDYYAVALADDPLVSQQWGRALLHLNSAKLPANAPTVKVAVIDSGACFDHPDLAQRYLPGWDYIENDADPRDVFGHGCEVSGIIAAVENNGLGIAGVSAQIRILPYRVLDGQGVGRYSNVAAAIVRAVNDGAQVINLSLGGPSSSDLLAEAVAYARQTGVVVVAAAGNSGQPQVFYPAALDGVISVGSIGEQLVRSSFSNYGKVDLWAAGENVLTTMMDGTYSRVNGTSFAAPHVAGLAALEIATGRMLVADGKIATYGGGGSDLTALPTPMPTQSTTVSTHTKPAMKNPAALACKNLGYEYLMTTDGNGGEDGDCLMPDSSACAQWDFYAGTCGQAFNFCAQQGYQTVSLNDGKDPFSPVYAACADANGQVVGSVTDLSALQAQAAGCEDGSCDSSLPEPNYSEANRVDPATDPVSALAVPTSWDWHNKDGINWLSPVKNQGSCGSCGVFSAVGAIEAALKISSGNPAVNPDLAEQYMISTCYQNPNSICGNGSQSDWTLTTAKTTGLCDEGCMPYTAATSNCGNRCGDWSSRLIRISDFGYTWSGITQTYIKQLIVNRGPVVAYMRISNGSYSNGTLTCSQDTPLDHAVVLVGYNDVGNYWIMRNSWGSSWGTSGYTRIPYGDCGIDSTYIAFAQALPNAPAATNLVRNGTFDQGTAQWQAWGEVDWAATGGVLSFKRRTPSPTGFSLYQDLNYRLPQSTPVEVLVELGNTSSVPKTVDLNLRNITNWDGAATCRFTLPPNAPMQTFSMELVTGEWPNARFEVNLLQPDNLPDVKMDNVRIAPKTGITALKCRYPSAPAETELLTNGEFDQGGTAWDKPADLGWSFASGELTVTSKPADQARAFYQNTARRMTVNAPVDGTFTVKNPNAEAKMITVTITDDSNPDWNAPNIVRCTFTIPANLTTFAAFSVRGKLHRDMANVRIHIDMPVADSAPNLIFGSVSLFYKPSMSLSGTQCLAPSELAPTSAPTLVIPASPTNNPTVTITVGTVQGGAKYELNVASNTSFLNMLEQTTLSDTLSYTTGTLSDGTVYIRARALSALDIPGPWSATKPLVIDTQPAGVPNLTAPASGVTLMTYTPTFTWQAVAGAAGYDVSYGPLSGEWSITKRVTTASYLMERPLRANVPMTWAVRSADALGNLSAWSASRTFTITTPLNTAPRPNTQSQATLKLTWFDVPYAQGYEIQVATDKAFAKIVYGNATLTASDTFVQPTLEEGAYYYRVRAKLGTTWGAWTAPVSFVVERP